MPALCELLSAALTGVFAYVSLADFWDVRVLPLIIVGSPSTIGERQQHELHY